MSAPAIAVNTSSSIPLRGKSDASVLRKEESKVAGGGHGMDPNDIFKMFFGGGGGM